MVLGTCILYFDISKYTFVRVNGKENVDRSFNVWEIMLYLFVWFLWWLCKKEVLKNFPQSAQGSLLLGYLFYLAQNVLQYLNLINYTWQQPAQSDFSGLVHFFAKAHKKSQDNNFEWQVQPCTLVPALKSFGSWLNIGWNLTYDKVSAIVETLLLKC